MLFIGTREVRGREKGGGASEEQTVERDRGREAGQSDEGDKEMARQTEKGRGGRI